jgi:hypothetical protein
MQLRAKMRLPQNILKAMPQSKHRKQMQKPSQKHVADVAAAEVATVRKRPQTQQPKLQHLPKRKH